MEGAEDGKEENDRYQRDDAEHLIIAIKGAVQKAAGHGHLVAQRIIPLGKPTRKGYIPHGFLYARIGGIQHRGRDALIFRRPQCQRRIVELHVEGRVLLGRIQQELENGIRI